MVLGIGFALSCGVEDIHDTLEFLVGGEWDGNLAFSGGGAGEFDGSAEVGRELVAEGFVFFGGLALLGLRPLVVGGVGVGGFGGLVVVVLADHLLDASDGIALLDGLVEEHELGLAVLDAHDGAGVTHGDELIAETVADLLREFEEAEVVCYRGAFLADLVGEGLLGEVALVD